MKTFKEYEEAMSWTAIYPNAGKNIIYPTLGLCGESGEFAEKIKKVIRDSHNEISMELRELLILELGDVLWYLSALCKELDTDLETVAEANIEKLYSRKDRDMLGGSGDQR